MRSQAVHLRFPAKAEYLLLARLAVAGVARGVPLAHEEVNDLKLAVTEACGNAVRHAKPSEHGVVLVDFGLEDETIEIRVEDAGPGIGTLPAAELERDELAESGMGLAIIQALVDDLEIRGGDGGRGTVVRMRKRLATA